MKHRRAEPMNRIPTPTPSLGNSSAVKDLIPFQNQQIRPWDYSTPSSRGGLGRKANREKPVDRIPKPRSSFCVERSSVNDRVRGIVEDKDAKLTETGMTAANVRALQ